MAIYGLLMCIKLLPSWLSPLPQFHLSPTGLLAAILMARLLIANWKGFLGGKLVIEPTMNSTVSKRLDSCLVIA